MNGAIVSAGGIGTRLGSDIPKQYIRVCGHMIITRSLATLCRHPQIDAIQIVASDVWQDEIISDLNDMIGFHRSVRIGFSHPGETRQLSIYNGLIDLKGVLENDSLVLVQDAVRPLTTDQIISDCLAACADYDGAMPVLPMKDTVYLSDGGQRVSGLLDRGRIFAGQAPEAFKFGKYLRANQSLIPDRIRDICGSTEPAVVAGMDIAMIPGDENNFKITTTGDLDRYKDIIEGR